MIPNDVEVPLSGWSVFVAVAETGGFSSAARRLGGSKAMVSTTVTKLEAALGAKLFQRTTRKLSLTEAGASALPHAQRALTASRDATEAALQTRLSPRGTLKVSAPMTFGLLHVAPALGAFARQFPELKVELVLDDRMVDLVAGGFDLALRIGDLPDSALIATRLGTNRSVLVATPEWLASRPRLKRPEDLANEPALVYSLAPRGDRWTVTRKGREVTVRVRAVIEANNSLALREMALQGLGIARIPRFAVEQELESGALTRVLPGWEFAEQGIFAVTTAREYQPLKSRAFIDFFRKRLSAV